MDGTQGSVVELLNRLTAGDKVAEQALMDLVYDELRRIAASYLRRERPDHTLQPTALVHEAYLRLVKQSDVPWEDRAHLLALAATMMRRVLIDYAKARSARKRPKEKVPLDAIVEHSDQHPEELLDLDDALKRLAAWDPRQSKIVELRVFGGLTQKEIGEVLGISARQVGRDWDMAKAWLHGELA